MKLALVLDCRDRHEEVAEDWRVSLCYFTVDKKSGQDGAVCCVEPLDDEAHVYAAEEFSDAVVAALSDGVDGAG